MNDAWIADRMKQIEASGIRKAFDMSKSMKNPINLSIGLPDFDVAPPVKAATIEAIEQGRNAYTLTQGIPELRGKLQSAVDTEFGHQDRQVIVTSGTSGALLLALSTVVNPGDEVIVFDPYFVMYGNLVALAGGTTVLVDTYPDFRIDVEKVSAAITGRTKCIIVNSPANPTGVVASAEEIQALATLCRERGILLISDEVYRAFCYDDTFATPATWNDHVLVVDGFSKAHGMTGWRLGFAHGPARLIQEMAKLQQFSFVCAPSLVQYAGVVALDQDLDARVDAYRKKRDAVVEALSESFDLACPAGAFYAFPRAPWGTATEFVAEAIRRNLLIIPGNVFSKRDTHFRISYAVDDTTLARGLDILREMARTPVTTQAS
ncbi:pyridoxal phosphate-dependent aminotransferase [Singulisphaera acidiphila]|uniref:Aminotransferase n=1 Tax=Singulisphaera acidiphila (strain ATCC BAA-1392 / DSM 18658 / VKM B-2454 / MOB10) TaxID=886293 RepID=L0DE88_SINAD|nr:aminotransferase class I/II-fold pyridoxal phosphate-dependent enzyme [Singulisphaera acidiphila]AGA27567.1 aspartate/tyrosine/aromatic aminotransferase [Singulisphaera acidiphila DSM 18658]